MTTAETSTGESGLPTVAIPPRRAPMLIFIVALIGLAAILFVSLESARMARQPASELPASATDDVALRSAPTAELYIPPAATPTAPVSALYPPTRYVAPAPILPPSQYRPPESAAPPVRYAPPAAGYDGPASPPAWSPPPSAPVPEARADNPSAAPARIMAGRIRNLSSTVVQGTLLRAVLETALDSTRPGQARALVTRDVRGFDGARVLIPRGSRLFGEYGSETAAGQNRLMIRWSRLILPGGTSIALDSPVADPLGRAGVRAKVDSHLMTRLGNAIIDSGASASAGLLGRRLGSSNQVIVALPGAVQSWTTAQPSQQITPTLRVKQGERITVFVAHDLDFADNAP